MRNIHIAHIAPPDLLTPPTGYGGTERIAAYLTDELVALGCQVDLYAPLGSKTRGTLYPTTLQPLRDMAICKDIPTRDRIREQVVQMAIHRAARSTADVIVNHVPQGIGYYESLKSRVRVPPMVTVVHNPLDPNKSGGHMSRYYDRHPMHPLITISYAQRSQRSSYNHFATIHHGIDPDEFPFGEGEGGYLLYLARMASEKGAHRAIAIAKRAKIPLILAGMPDSDHEEYFATEVMPHVDGKLITHVGEVAGEQKQKLLANAVALIAPLDEWPEPFGLYYLEAMFSGTPVITTRNRYSAAGEVVNHGVGGLLAESMDEFVEAAQNIAKLDRTVVRQWALSRFTKRHMALKYKDVLTRLTMEDAVTPQMIRVAKRNK